MNFRTSLFCLIIFSLNSFSLLSSSEAPHEQLETRELKLTSKGITKTGALFYGLSRFLKHQRSLANISEDVEDTIDEWPRLMKSVVFTMKDVGDKYWHKMAVMKHLTGMEFPYFLARSASGVSRSEVKIKPLHWESPFRRGNKGEAYFPVRNNLVIPSNLREDNLERNLQGRNQIILYFHGGAMCLCTPKTHREMLLRLSDMTGRVIIAPNYRKPPEFPYPTPVNDAYDAYIKIAEGSPGTDIILAGDSAGGTLALSVAKRALEEKGVQNPHSVLLISPWVNLADTTSQSFDNNKGVDYLPRPAMRAYAEAYAGKHSLQEVSPSSFDVEDLPDRMMMIYGGSEMLSDQQKAFAKKAGERMQVVHEWPDMPHVPTLFAPFFEEEDLDELEEDLRTFFNSNEENS